MKRMRIEENVCLQAYNTFSVPAKARYFSNITSTEDAQSLIAEPRWSVVRKLVLGGGSNLLFTRDFAGLVIHNAISGIEVKEKDDHVLVTAGAGENWHQLVQYCVKQNFYGIENLSLIPGSVGAAPVQNIGAYGVELKDVFHKLVAINLRNGSLKEFSAEDCEFAYRDSVFKYKLANQYLICQVTLRLSKIPRFTLDYAGIQQALEKLSPAPVSLQAVNEAIIQIRQQKLPDPKVLGNAGSFFKNPVISEAHMQRLLHESPSLPYYQLPGEPRYKIPAAWLIEQAGWKGKRVEGCGVHEQHALVLVNYEHVEGEKILQLAQKIIRSVKNQFSIMLVPEVTIL
jgi:UDP-N-acetylmuramate dehydrogenase